MNITEAVDMISEVVADSAAEVMISRVERCRLGRRLHTLSPSPLLERLSILGVEEHWHGDGTYESPCWTHAHPFEDKKHEHAGTPEERAAQDAARAEWE